MKLSQYNNSSNIEPNQDGQMSMSRKDKPLKRRESS